MVFKVVSEERQRQRAKFESRLNRFKSVDESNNGLGSSGGSPFARSNSTEVRNKAEYFANMAQGKPVRVTCPSLTRLNGL